MIDDLRNQVARAMAYRLRQPNDCSLDADDFWQNTGSEGQTKWLVAADAALAEMGGVRVREAARLLLDSYDAFMAGKPENEHTRAVSTAACFGAAAYEKGVGGQGVHALARSFLIALIDPSDAQLDYLRADPKSGETAREAVAALRAIAEGKDDE